MIKRLRRRFIAVAMLSVFIVLAVIVTAASVSTFAQLNSEADSILQLLAENGGYFPKTDKPHGGYGGKNSFSAETPFETRYFTVLLDDENEALTVNTGSIAAVETEDAIEYAEEAVESGKTTGYAEHYKFLLTRSDGRNMLIFLDCGRNLSTLKSFVFNSVWMSAVGLGGVFVLVLIFSKVLLRPVAESYEKQKRFITDAGHEIKTPLTIIGAGAEVLEMENGSSEWTESIKNQVDRLAALTEGLVALTRMDEENNALIMTDFSLSDAVGESVEEFAVLVKAAGKHLETDIEQNLTLCGNEKSIRQLVSILLDNAVKYSDPDGRIVIRLAAKGHRRELSVFNTVAYIEPGSHDVLFERFYRADSSRNSETGGSGIGLSVAQAIVTSHKGRITAQSIDGKSLCISAVL